jgi:WD40 repeat protein
LSTLGTQIGEIFVFSIWSSNFLPLPVLTHLSLDKTIKLWNATTGNCQSTLTVVSEVNSVAFCPDGSKIAIAHWRHIQIFDSQTQAKLGSPLTGHSDL